MRNKFLLTLAAFAFAAAATAGVAYSQKTPTNASGTWNVRYSGLPMSREKMVLHMEGAQVVGTYGAGSNLRGNINANNPYQVDATWNDSTGNGWATLIFSPDWKTFSGRWGLPGRQPKGTFVAKRWYFQIDTAGLWDVTLTGIGVHQTQLRFTQNGSSFIGQWPNGHVQGTIPPGATEVHGTWQTKKNSGPVYFTFNKDGTRFDGTWGYPGRVKGRVHGTKLH